jgi:outer membrane protein OmpA-like peptidoglycan-associated protein
MRFRFSYLAAICFLAASQTIVGCNTVAGFGRDVQWAGRAVERAGGGDEQAATTGESTAPASGQSMAAVPAGDTVYFSLGSADLTADGRRAIDSAVGDVRRQSSLRIKVIGYTDTSGSSNANEQLSLRRAEAVADELVAQGVPRDMIDISGRGEADLAVQTSDGIVEPKNRRASIELGA